MHRILINALTIKEGGGIVVLSRLLDAMCFLEPNTHWLVVVDDLARNELKAKKNVTFLTFPWIKKSPLHFFFWYEYYLPKLIFRIKISLFFSQTNFMPFRKLRCPSLLLVHHAGYFSSLYSALYLDQEKSWASRLGWVARCYWARASIKRASKITVQTQALSTSIMQSTKAAPDKMTVIPHGPGLSMGKEESKDYPTGRIWRIGYITKHGVQKNVCVLLKSIQQLKAINIRCKLVLTLSMEHRYYKKIDNLIKQYDITDCIENHGETSGDLVRALYQSLDVFVYPSLCESFGLTLVEAMYYGIPILAANTHSNYEVLGTEGLFFEFDNANDLTKKIYLLMTSRPDYHEAAKHSLSQSKYYNWDLAAKNILNVMRQMIL